MSELPPHEPSIAAAGADAGGRKAVAHEARGAAEPDQFGRGENRELIEAWRAVANAKLVEFRQQSRRLAVLGSRGVVGKIAAVDRLWEIAIAHALVRALGEVRVQAIISEAFAATHQEAA
ncbi:MAG: hypothetical protein QOH31_6835 [Verrucomicrobiota bacterium]|jgi:hypothetical protein